MNYYLIGISVPIFNILTKLYNLGIRGKCHLFLKNLYLSSKARAFFNGNFSEEFSINRGVNSNLSVKLNWYFRFIINKSIFLPLKKYILISFILCLVLYYAPLFGSNMSRCFKVQKLLIEDFVGVMDLNLVVLMLVSMIFLN